MADPKPPTDPNDELVVLKWLLDIQGVPNPELKAAEWMADIKKNREVQQRAAKKPDGDH